MRNLIVCCDGTWNTSDQQSNGVPTPTNVVRLHNAVAGKDSAENQQLKYYHPGVGTEGSWWQKIAGGSIGIGLDKNIMSAYRWLGVNYQENDRIFLFGFSRGAFTARSLGGMLTKCNLLDLTDLSDSDSWTRVEAAYNQCYRVKNPPGDWSHDWKFHVGSAEKATVGIYCIGVWDTVGALGVPNDMAILNLFDNPSRYAFHDTKLSEKVENARHAVALDEMRASFTPTLWTGVAERQNVKQIWFPGVHSDVGGGYAETGLSDGALNWMIEEVTGLGLEFESGMVEQIEPNALDVLHDSDTGMFSLFRTRPRSIPLIIQANQPNLIHPSALERQATPPITQAPYRPTIVLQPGESCQLPIYAANPWNPTGIYLEKGARYRFSATGQWLDRDVKCTPAGPEHGNFQLGELAQLAGTLWGEVEKGYKAVTGNQEADFRMTKRQEDMPWFSLVGAIVNGGNPMPDGSPQLHETFLIGDGCNYPSSSTSVIEKPGYLYCYANDSWHFYDNNRGSVMLTVKRLS